MKVQVYRYDAFTKVKGKGNPAGVIFDADKYTTAEMQEVARQIGFSECVFIRSSDKANLQLRYFTPGAEVNLCGHATMASVYSLFKDSDPEGPAICKKVETNAEIIEVSYDPKLQEVTMTQSDAQFKPVSCSMADLAACIGLTEDDIDGNYPVLFGSTGLWTVIVPIKTLEAFARMKPDNKSFPKLFPELPNASVHPICLETFREEASVHGRHFSGANTGRIEDPITGTASGVTGAYYIQYIHPDMESCDIIVEQGQDAGYDGVVHVWDRKEDGAIKVKIAGTASEVCELEAEI
ncbi:MAG: PhzF family phenazine biosynthesis isomerase [Clostridia bacterium]|nr:PhzF family phenazine biosynthesis isomerase [Clostridia bacterium]